MNIQQLLEKFAHLNRKVGDLRTEVINFERNSHAWNDSLDALQRNTKRLAELEDTLIDMGLLNEDARYEDVALSLCLELKKGLGVQAPSATDLVDRCKWW